MGPEEVQESISEEKHAIAELVHAERERPLAHATLLRRVHCFSSSAAVRSYDGLGSHVRDDWPDIGCNARRNPHPVSVVVQLFSSLESINARYHYWPAIAVRPPLALPAASGSFGDVRP
jgi:hypothetical protein